ncbi:hypothetical protein P152DRAFT_258788 [Eremomyces bilateralis CBS 781.70]|uniref:Uncharacterized protein n=1 Tax=Eremomyces bilateralis CBS 781.70 TaxID=1392243 RepID=A0A6G1FQM0_9PEZI|nr:uncharacterized protein P152DRAFT_258788 [Eremomyces bilateralis CBS 781.70]KAF1808028.1 hypothetical protein P152DRAFT_258788 [Eremomyces bilateralis CBS 781.70]
MHDVDDDVDIGISLVQIRTGYAAWLSRGLRLVMKLNLVFAFQPSHVGASPPLPIAAAFAVQIPVSKAIVAPDHAMDCAIMSLRYARPWSRHSHHAIAPPRIKPASITSRKGLPSTFVGTSFLYAIVWVGHGALPTDRLRPTGLLQQIVTHASIARLFVSDLISSITALFACDCKSCARRFSNDVATALLRDSELSSWGCFHTPIPSSAGLLGYARPVWSFANGFPVQL